MTEEEYDLKNAKLAKRRKYLLGVSILAFLLTSYYVGLFIPIDDFMLSLFFSAFLGLNIGALLIGIRITSKTNFQWIFSFSISLITSLYIVLTSYLTDDVSRDQRIWARTFVLVNSVSLAFSVGVGTFVLFNSEIERIAKILWLAKPNRESILKIESSEADSN